MENVKKTQTLGTLKKLLRIAPELHYIKHLNRIFQYNDEPKFYQYSAETYIDETETDGHLKEKWKAGGSSMFDEKSAFLKCMAEAIERYSCMVYKHRDFIFGSYKDLGEKAINPKKFSKFTDKQKKLSHLKNFVFDDNTPFTWVKAQSIRTNDITLIPAQLIYHNYKIPNRIERLIDLPISTGAAFGQSLEDALVRGFFEIIERDSFSIMYLNKIECPKVDLTLIDDYRIQYILDLVRRYRLELHMMDITTDIKIPAFAAIVINRTGIGPAVQVGIKSHFDPLEAMVGAFQESLHTRCWMRYLYENELDKYKTINPIDIDSFEKRGIYWYNKKMINKINYWLNIKTSPLKHDLQKTLTPKRMLKLIIKILKDHKYDAYYVDLTTSLISKTGCKVIKVVSPDFQPHFFNEKYKLLGGKRLEEVPSILGYKKPNLLNKLPHPFL